MKNIQLIMAIAFVFAVSFMAQSQTNYDLYTIEYIDAYCPSADNNSLYTIETLNDVNTLIKRNVATGEIEKTYKTKLPSTDISAMAVSGDGENIYLITGKDVENSRLPFSDVVYSISLKNGNLKELLSLPDGIKFTTQLVVMGKSLLIKPYKSQSYLLNLSSNTLNPILEDETYRMIFAAPEQNGAVFAKMADSEMMDMYFLRFF